MKKNDIPKTNTDEEIKETAANAESELNEYELSVLRSRYDELDDDRSKIPPPEKKNQNKLVKFAKKNTLAAVVISVFAVALAAAVILLVVYAVNTFLISESKRDYRFTFGEEEIKVKYEETVINDVLYVDMNKLAEFTQMSVSGSAETMKYIVSADQYLKFTDDSEYAVINASKVSISAPAVVKDGKCLVPYSVISKAVASGLTFKSDSVRNTVDIKRVTYTVDDVEYNEDITFSTEDFKVVQAIQSTAGVEFEYTKDVSAYLEYIDPRDNSPYLVLVNADNPLSSSYVPQNLSAIPSSYTAIGEIYELENCAAQALIAMIRDMNAESANNGAYVTSAYRSYAYQLALFEGYIEDYVKKGYSASEAEAEVLKTSARPGTSEHQSGLCVDFITTAMKNGLNNDDFESTRAFEWLSKNSYKYGFILRYPEDKTDLTSYSYESWHFRFVGRTAATEMYVSGLCLEEYLELI
ncbi:MAG: D-alanyl-D-alanine carboxypeptidase family protein [Clostridia bacterium]|nr:D-alanyl-D-alanine carboxypeptidase family protein [Clostridia bacterium]